MERINQLKSFLQGSPGDPFLLHALALEYIKVGEDQSARSIFEDLLDKHPAYTGSYYHLAKLLERNGDIALALEFYQRGMKQAREAGDNHTFNELRSAYDELAD